VAFHVRRSGRFTARVITVNLNDPDIRVGVAIARGGIGSSEGFGSFLSRLRPVAALTGTHFSVVSQVPVSDLAVLGHRLHTGFIGTNLVLGQNNRAIFLNGAKFRLHPPTFSTVIGAGPRLLRRGVFAVHPRREGYRDPGLFGRRLRVAIGLTRHNKLLLVTVKQPLQFGELAWLMKDLGAVDAMAMDGGGSSAQSFRDRALVHPARKLTNLLVVYETAAGWRQACGSLAPGVPCPRLVKAKPLPPPVIPVWPVQLTAAPQPCVRQSLAALVGAAEWAAARPAARPASGGARGAG